MTMLGRLVLSLEFNGFRMLLMGDLTGGGLGSPDMEGLLAPSLDRVNVLRTGHHGSRTSSSGPLLLPHRRKSACSVMEKTTHTAIPLAR